MKKVILFAALALMSVASYAQNTTTNIKNAETVNIGKASEPAKAEVPKHVPVFSYQLPQDMNYHIDLWLDGEHAIGLIRSLAGTLKAHDLAADDAETLIADNKATAKAIKQYFQLQEEALKQAAYKKFQADSLHIDTSTIKKVKPTKS